MTSGITKREREVTDVNEISKEDYEKILNESLDYISRKFKD